MTKLTLNTSNAPECVQKKLAELSGKYEITAGDEKGANGILFFGKNKVLGTDIAVKFYYWGGKDQYHAEPKILTSLKCDHLLSVLDADYVDDEYAYFVSPFFEGGDLDNIIASGTLSTHSACGLLQGILNGLSYLHAERLLHRDLKPSNIFIDATSKVVIGDFGSLRRMPDGQSDVPASSHSILYRPPEAFGAAGKFDRSSDIYQAGIVLYQALGGHLPYEEEAWLTPKEQKELASLGSQFERSKFVDERIETLVKKGKLLDHGSYPPWVPDRLRRVVRRATNRDKDKRFGSTAEFMSALAKACSTGPVWSQAGGIIEAQGKSSYRIIEEGGFYRAEKRGAGPEWRKDNSLNGKSLAEMIEIVEQRLT